MSHSAPAACPIGTCRTRCAYSNDLPQAAYGLIPDRCHSDRCSRGWPVRPTLAVSDRLAYRGRTDQGRRCGGKSVQLRRRPGVPE